LLKALDGLGFAWDVRISGVPDIPRNYRSVHNYGGKVKNDPDAYEGGNRAVAYLHRSVPGAEVCFFSNASSLEITADVQLRGKLQLELWDPHGGDIRQLESSIADEHGEPVTCCKLTLPAVRSAFIVGRKM
jgi:hypothetical protein